MTRSPVSAARVHHLVVILEGTTAEQRRVCVLIGDTRWDVDFFRSTRDPRPTAVAFCARGRVLKRRKDGGGNAQIELCEVVGLHASSGLRRRAFVS